MPKLESKFSSNVWLRAGSKFTPVLNMPVSNRAAEAILMILSHDYGFKDDDFSLTVSTQRPISYGYKAENDEHVENVEPAK